ncbi:MAG: hemerythrin domain-containing protein [Solirubrobacteraceae bacterium]
MRRSKALAILSRDHHQALVVASALRRADDADAAQARRLFLEFWEREGQNHFRQEEELLLPAYAVFGDAYDPLVLRMLGDHVVIRAQAAGLITQPDSNADTLHRLAARLTAHVRLEERELFPVIEQTMPPKELAELALTLEQARQNQG